MARMYPSDIENYVYQPSEKYMYEKFRDMLPEKYHVFFSVRWFEFNEGKRVDSESDFIVFDPSFGFLTIEVKGGRGIEQNGTEWLLKETVDGEESTRRLKCSPYEQAEKSMRHFYEYFRDEFHQTFNGAYGFAVAFPWYSASSVFSSSSPKELTIDANNIDRLPERINEIFHYWKNKRNLSVPFSQEQRQRFISLINKRISLSAAAGALIGIQKKEFDKVNIAQDNILDALVNYRELRFLGGAGTGKTFIGAKKGLREAANGRKVLFTCCSKNLADYIRAVFYKDSINVKCADFYSLMSEYLGSEFDNAHQNHSFFDCISRKRDIIKFDSIIIDEGQDYDVDMGLATRALLKDDFSVFYVLFDENQNIFSKDFDNAFAIDSPPVVLRYNIRNTGKIYDKAVELTKLGTETVSSPILGVEPETASYKNRAQCIKALTNIINRLVDKEQVPLSSIIILGNTDIDNSILCEESHIGRFEIDKSEDMSIIDNGRIRYSTVSDYKGLEADVVIYIKHENGSVAPELAMKENYVALTRARYYLYILNVVTI